MLSVVIPAFNEWAYTEKCISSLFNDQHRPFYEMIVIDNHSTDSTHEALKKLVEQVNQTPQGDHLQIITNPENHCVAHAWNQGLSASTGEYVAILNNDIIVPDGWMDGVLFSMKQFQLSLASPFPVEGMEFSKFSAWAGAFQTRNRNQIWKNTASFCAFVLHRSLYEKIGGFDENFRIGGYEDTDYLYKLRKNGLSHATVGASVVYHFGSQTMGQFKKRGDLHVSHNRTYFIKKWGEDPSKKDASFPARLIRRWRKWKTRFGYF